MPAQNQTDRLAKSISEQIASNIPQMPQQPLPGSALPGQSMLDKNLLRETEVLTNKQLRVELDASLQKLKGATPSRERSLSITKIQEAIMWLGMDLKRLNEPNPYPESYNTTNAIVEPTADGLKL